MAKNEALLKHLDFSDSDREEVRPDFSSVSSGLGAPLRGGSRAVLREGRRIPFSEASSPLPAGFLPPEVLSRRIWYLAM